MTNKTPSDAILDILDQSAHGPAHALRELADATAVLVETTAYEYYIKHLQKGESPPSYRSLIHSLYGLVDGYLEDAKEKYRQDREGK